MKRILLLPYTFALMNWAAVVAFYYFARRRTDVWVRSEWAAPVQEPNS